VVRRSIDLRKLNAELARYGSRFLLDEKIRGAVKGTGGFGNVEVEVSKGCEAVMVGFRISWVPAA
jgi:hypothetical protein